MADSPEARPGRAKRLIVWSESMQPTETHERYQYWDTPDFADWHGKGVLQHGCVMPYEVHITDETNLYLLASPEFAYARRVHVHTKVDPFAAVEALKRLPASPMCIFLWNTDNANSIIIRTGN